MHGGDARVLELARDAGLAQEALLGDGQVDAGGEQARDVEGLEGHLAADGGVEGEPDDALAARAELPPHLVAAGLLGVDGRARELAVDGRAAATGAPAAVAHARWRGRGCQRLAVTGERRAAVVVAFVAGAAERRAVGDLVVEGVRERSRCRAPGGGERGLAVVAGAASRQGGAARGRGEGGVAIVPGRARSRRARHRGDGVLRAGLRWVWPLRLHGAVGSWGRLRTIPELSAPGQPIDGAGEGLLGRRAHRAGTSAKVEASEGSCRARGVTAYYRLLAPLFKTFYVDDQNGRSEPTSAVSAGWHTLGVGLNVHPSISW